MLKTNHGWVHAKAPAYAHIAFLDPASPDLPKSNYDWRTLFGTALVGWANSARAKLCTHPQAALRRVDTTQVSGMSCDNCYRFFPADEERPFEFDADPETEELLDAFKQGLQLSAKERDLMELDYAGQAD